jgi:hypothetical protein
VCKLIKHLLRDKGYSLEYAKKELEVYRKCPPRNDYVCKSADDALNLLSEVAKMINGNLQGNRIKILGDKQRWRCVNDDRCREIL